MPEEPARPPLVLIGTIVGESRQIGVFLEEDDKGIGPARDRRGSRRLDASLGRSARSCNSRKERAPRRSCCGRPIKGKGPASATIPMAELKPSRAASETMSAGSLNPTCRRPAAAIAATAPASSGPWSMCGRMVFDEGVS